MQGTAKSASTVKRKVLRIYSFFTKNVRRTFLSIMLFSILIPYAIITIFSFSRLIKQSKEDFSRNNRQLSGNAATYFGAYLRSIDQVGLELYSDIVLSNYLQRGITTFITESEQHRYTEERIRSFYYQINDACLSRYASADHAVEATYGVTRWHACSYISNLQYTPYQQIHESVDDFPDDDTRISFYCFGENNTQYLAYTRAVQFLTSEEINGFLTLVINPAKLIDTARSFLGSENDSLFIYSDTEKQMILGAGNTDISEEVSTVLSDNEAISEETPERMTLGGQPSLLYRYPIKDCGVTLCWITSAKMNLSGITGTLWYTALLLGIVFLASLLLMIWLSKSVTHSVDQLITKQVENAAAMQQMEYRTLQATMNPHFIANTLQPIGKNGS